MNIKDAFANFVRLAQDKVKLNPSYFWSYVNTKRKNSRIPSNLTIGDSNIKLNDPLTIVNGFASQFSSVFNTNPMVGSSTNINNISCGSVICDNGNCDNVHSHQ